MNNLGLGFSNIEKIPLNSLLRDKVKNEIETIILNDMDGSFIYDPKMTYHEPINPFIFFKYKHKQHKGCIEDYLDKFKVFEKYGKYGIIRSYDPPENTYKKNQIYHLYIHIKLIEQYKLDKEVLQKIIEKIILKK